VEEKLHQKREQKVTPIIISLKHLDFWYWSKYFIDIYRPCPFNCCYCNTQTDVPLRGIKFLPGLPSHPHTIGLGLLSDIYHPESQRNATVTNILGMLHSMEYPITILTKSDRIVENIDILKKFSQKGRIRVTFTILSLDEQLSSKLEGLAPSPSRRLDALHLLNREGIPAGVAITPIIPFITDGEKSLANLVKEAKKKGAKWVLFSGFSAVPSEKKDVVSETIASIHSDTRKLEKRYKKIKRYMIGLLFEEKLPMRIPRITLNQFGRSYCTNLTSEYLFNISYLYELLERELEMIRYRRVAHELDTLNQSLKNITTRGNLGYLKGVNPEIEGIIKEMVYSGTSEFYTNLLEKVVTEV
jgi:DNA repair photolyase